MRSFIFPLLYILCANATTVAIFKKKFGKCLPITLLLSVFPLFFSGLLFSTFKYGIILDIIYACIFIIILRKKNFVENYFSAGFYAAIFLYIGVYIFNIGRDISEWDEYSHWGIMVKEMFRLDKFYSVNESTLLLHKDYPPVVPLFEYFWAKISGGFSEAYLLTSLKFLMLSFFIPVIEFFKYKNKRQVIIKTAVVILMVVFTALLFDMDRNFNTLYVDFFVAILPCYLLFDIFTNEELLSKFSLFSYCVMITFLLLTKQICIVLYAMVLFMFVAKMALNYKKILNNKKILKLVCVLLFVVVIPISCILIWNNYTYNFDGVDRQFVLSDIKLSKLPAIFNGTSDDYYDKIIGNFFVDSLYSAEITTSYVKLSYVQCGVVAAVILYLLFKKFKAIYSKNEYIMLTVTLALGYLGYAFVLLNLYLFCFYQEEGLALASFERYMSSYMLIILFLCILLYYYGLFKTNEKDKKPLIILILLFLLETPFVLRGIEFYQTLNLTNQGYQMQAEHLEKNVPKGSKVFQIAQYISDGRSIEFFDEKRYQYYIHYYANEIIMNKDKNNFDINENIDGKQYFESNIKAEMLKYDYVYLAVIDDKFIAKYDFLFEDKNAIKAGNIFNIIENDDQILLREIKEYKD